jgi:hypothetical protein
LYYLLDIGVIVRSDSNLGPVETVRYPPFHCHRYKYAFNWIDNIHFNHVLIFVFILLVNTYSIYRQKQGKEGGGEVTAIVNVIYWHILANNIIRIIKSRRMRWAGHVARTGGEEERV